jgi:hypothetical protein
MWVLLCGLARREATQWSQATPDGGISMHSLIYHLIKHLLRGLGIVITHLVHHAPAAHTAVRHAAVAHTAVRHAAAAHAVAANTLGGTQAAGGASAMAAMPAARSGTVPLRNTAAALGGFNQQGSIMASVGQEQAAAIPDVGDFSY